MTSGNPLHLKTELAARGLKQAALARHLGISGGSMSQIVNHGLWPKTMKRAQLKQGIAQFLTQHGAAPETVGIVFNEAPPAPRANAVQGMAARAADSGPQGSPQAIPEDVQMLLRKHTLTREARGHFKIPRDPFTDEMRGEADVFLSDDIRYVRASMRQTAKHGGMLAVIAESGGGKSTLRHDLNDWIAAHHEPITVIEPYVLGMEESQEAGKPLRASDITSALIRNVAPGMRLRQSAEDRAAQLHALLKESAQVGRRHVLVIEEAHALPTTTIKHLKRFYELQDGFRKLLAIILIGQTELEWKLSEHNPAVREVVQRCEIVKLPPLDNHVEAYLRHKLARVDLDFGALFTADAVDEIRSRLRRAEVDQRQGARGTRSVSLCHPLAINNLVSAALNEAVKIGAPKVTGALIAAAARAA